VNLFRYKLLAFGIGCSMAGVTGALLAHSTGLINSGMFAPSGLRNLSSTSVSCSLAGSAQCGARSRDDHRSADHQPVGAVPFGHKVAAN